MMSMLLKSAVHVMSAVVPPSSIRKAGLLGVVMCESADPA